MAYLDNNGLLYLLQKLDGRYQTESDVNGIANNAIQSQVQNSSTALGAALAGKASTSDLAAKANSADLKAVATSGSYTDLSDKPTIPSSASDVSAIAASDKGAANGVATLDANGKVPASQLPSFVDDVIECVADSTQTELSANWLKDTNNTLIVPESGKIYVVIATGYQYRWGGTAYVQLQSSSGVSSMSNAEIETAWVSQFGQFTAALTESPNVSLETWADEHSIDSVYIAMSNTTDGPAGNGTVVDTGLGVTPYAYNVALYIASTSQLVTNFSAYQWSQSVPGAIQFTGGFGPGNYQLGIAYTLYQPAESDPDNPPAVDSGEQMVPESP